MDNKAYLGIRAPKLTQEEQYQVCQWYAEFKTPTQIRKLIQDHFGKTLTNKNVWQYARESKKWKPMIERLRQEWALGVMDIPLAHKRARLEKLVDLLKRAEKNDQVQEFSRIQQAVVILREMREEMEVGKAEFTNVYMTTIHNYSDEEIIQQRDAVMARLKQMGDKYGLRRQVTSAGDGPQSAILDAHAHDEGEDAGTGHADDATDAAGGPAPDEAATSQAEPASGLVDGNGHVNAGAIQEATPVLRDAGAPSPDGQSSGHQDDPAADARLRDDFGTGAA